MVNRLSGPTGLLNHYNHYRKRGALFTPAERSFLSVLDQAVSDQYRVFGKVRVADILTPAKGMNRKNWQIAFNKISSKHYDYILCSKDTLDVVAAIELDDKSHSSARAKKRDALLESACDSAGLPLIRFKAKSGYQAQSIYTQIEAALNPPESGESLNKSSKRDAVFGTPSCGVSTTGSQYRAKK
jgi:hypothetical protein